LLVAKPQPAPALTVQAPAVASCSPLPESPDAPTYSLWTSPLAVANPFATLFPAEAAATPPHPPSEVDALRKLNQDLVGEMQEWVAELNNTKALLRNERALCTNLAARLAFASSELNRKEAVLVQLRGALKV
jgi:hypothetical protein